MYSDVAVYKVFFFKIMLCIHIKVVQSGNTEARTLVICFNTVM